MILVVVEPTPITRILPEINITMSHKETLFSTGLNITRGSPSFVTLVLGSVEPIFIRRLPLKINTILSQESIYLISRFIITHKKSVYYPPFVRLVLSSLLV